MTGVVRDKVSQTPIPFASISISNSTRGTSANEAGHFQLPIFAGDQYLKISCIGFHTKTFEITPHEDALKSFELEAEVIELEELQISQSRIDPAEIIQSAIDSIHVNYQTDSFNLEFYSRIKVSNALTKKEFSVESILLGYYEGYASGKRRFEVITKRTQGEDPLKMKEYPYWPTLEIHRGDLIADPEKTGIFNKKNLDKFEFKYEGALVYDTDTVYHIRYHAPKPTQKITGYANPIKTYEGEIFITVQTHAIIKHDLVTDQFQHSIIYRKIGNSYYPYSISGQRQLTGDAFTKVTNLISMTNLSLDTVQVIQSKTNEFEMLTNVPEDNVFWELNYPLSKD